MLRIRWSEGARRQLTEIVNYIAEDSPRAARRMRDRLKKAVSELREHPRIGRMVPVFADPAIRERIVSPYRVFYLVQETTIFILAILHSRRDLPEDPADLEEK